ncbi:ATP-binding protein [Limnohabitans sp. T6-5]|uniref:sensor histidine kinase n=1 Tax=Limnohabitans sp. T6-5 TaxID=1100724 RepID=UPI000D3B86D8|nr:sensor histidine kinase [Limnohabitans sp. T6-5]PUE05900.1 ATP-binding protein [Limnohabitans sp. T6-5]
MNSWRPWRLGGLVGSLRFRLLAATLIGLSLAMVLAGVVLNSLFHEHVMRQFEKGLTQQLDQLTARLSFDAQGHPEIDAQSLSDPRWQRPYSGLYWQLDDMTAAPPRPGVLRSRSLWDTRLALPADVLRDGEVHAHELTGPGDSRLRVLERTVRPDAVAGADVRWRLSVAADLNDTHEAVAGFQRVLGFSLAALLVLLLAATWAQVALGLRPLLALQQGLKNLREGRTPRLAGDVPSEVQPLVNDFNSVLDRNDEVVSRARTQAGNLAHALKTPLTVLHQAARNPLGADLATLVREQVQLARRHIDWHLARSRMAASTGMPGQRVPLVPTLQGLVRVMQRVHAERDLAITLEAANEGLQFAGEAQDLQEMLGNVLDNACQWAHSAVHIRVSDGAPPGQSGALATCHVAIEDDGPGMSAEQMPRVLQRGVRLDESVPGNGLGLAIVRELVDLYGGALQLQTPTQGRGLRVTLILPVAAADISVQKDGL